MKKKPLPKGDPTEPSIKLLAAVLAGIALITVIALDFLNSKKGGKSYLFVSTPLKAEKMPAPKAFKQVIRDALAGIGIASEAVAATEIEKNLIRFDIALHTGQFDEIESALESAFRAQEVSFGKKDRLQEKGSDIVRWQLQRGKDERAILAFSSPVAGAPAEEPSRRPGLPLKTAAAKVALVVDDMGNSLEILDELVSLNEPLTISILPYSRYAKETAEIAHAKGLEVLLHLPLESLNGQDFAMNPEGMIRGSMNQEEVEKLMEDNLNRIPFIRGVNNHMGSKVTADESMMRLILAPIKSRNLFFLDSRTTGRSVAYSVALDMGIPAAVRQVFLDADGDKVTIKDRLLELFRMGQRNGKAVGICHPFRETVQVLKDSFHIAEGLNVDVVPASRMARR